LENQKSEILNLKSKISKVVFHTKSAQETIRIGKKIGSLLLPGDVVALAGELGTGKTQFIKGLAEGAGVGKSTYISSPSFILISEYAGKVLFYHIDLYRLNSEEEAEALGLEEYFQAGGIAAIEWADKIPSLLPQGMLWIHIRHTGKHNRSFEIIGKGKRYEKLLKGFEESRGQEVKGTSQI
jgi:tRNA threonylcarbamoyladenosine biosynthesis protein TsaE